MTKAEFLTALQERLYGLPGEDIEKSLDYYSEIIDDRIEDGLSEEAAVDAIGPLDEIAAGILADTSLPKLVKAKLITRRKPEVWEIILLLLGSPIWLALLLTAGVVVLAAYIVLWTLVAVLYAVVLSLAAGAAAGILGAVPLAVTGDPAQGCLLAGIGLVCAGLTIFSFYAGNQAAKGAFVLGRKIWLGIKGCFLREESAE